MAFEMRFAISPRYLSGPSRRRPRVAMAPGVKFIVAHDTGNPGSTAAQNVAYYERSRDEQYASAHLFVDDREIIECVPALTGPPEKAWHVRYNVPADDRLFGFDANDAAVGVEYCFGHGINADESYDRYVWTMAYASYRHQLDPHRMVVGHFFLDPDRRTDPVTGLARSRRTYEQLLRDVVAEFKRCGGAAPPDQNEDENGRFPAKARATVRLNVRKGEPSTRAPIHRTVSPGTDLVVAAVQPNGEPVNGNEVWYAEGQNNYFWSGGVVVDWGE